MARFSPSEIALLRHRLEVSDCIIDVLCDHEDDEIAEIAVRDPSKVHFTCLQLMGEMEMGRSVEYVVALTTQQPLWREVLRDAVGGSTYVACIDDEVSPGKRGAAIRAARSVVRKLRAAGFICNDVPLV